MVDNKIRIIIIILVVLIVIVATGGTALYFTTDALKSKESLFQKYIAQNVQNIFDVVDISNEENIIDQLRKSDYKEEAEATVKYLEQQNDEEEVYNIKESGISKSSEDASYRNISAMYGDNVLVSVDLLKKDNTYGFRLANLVQQFVSVKNATISYFVSNLNPDYESYFSETLKEVDISGLLNFSSEELAKLTNTYANVIFQDIDKKHYSSSSNAIITLNNKQSIKAKSYTLTLTKNEVDKIYKRILNQAKSDEILLGKIDEIDKKIQEAGFNEPEGESIKERYTKKIQDIIDSLEYQGEDNRKITITVYESDGITYRTYIKTDEVEYTIDLDNQDGKTVSLKTTKYVENEREDKIYSLGIKNSEQELDRTFTYNDNTQNLTVESNTLVQNSKINNSLGINYKNEKITKFEVDSSLQIDLSAEEAMPIDFNENNNIVLNDYNGERVSSIMNSLKNRFVKSLEKSQSIINTKLLNNIILKIDEEQQKKDQEQQNEEEQQKQKFNNKFNIYEGDELDAEYIEKLLETVSQNMEDYKVLVGTQLRIYIKEGQKNEEKAEEIKAVIHDSREKYNVKLNYNENGYVESIDITVVT